MVTSQSRLPSLEPPQPHHMFLSPSVDGSEGVEFPAPWDVAEWPGGEAGLEVTLFIGGDVTWSYENYTCVPYQDEEPFLVQAGFEVEPKPLTRETVSVLVANQKSAGYTDSTGADVPTLDIVGGGDLYVLHGGEVIEGTWFRGSQVEEYVFSDVDGDLVPIPNGSLYMSIVPDTLGMGVAE